MFNKAYKLSTIFLATVGAIMTAAALHDAWREWRSLRGIVVSDIPPRPTIDPNFTGLEDAWIARGDVPSDDADVATYPPHATAPPPPPAPRSA